VNDNDRSLVKRDEPETQPEETLSQSIGGYQALAMLGATILFMFVVFAFPTTGNPNVVDPPDLIDDEQSNLLDTLGGLSVDDEIVAAAPTDAEPLVVATEEATEVATEEATEAVLAEVTDEPTEVVTEEVTAEPTEEITAEPTEVVTEEVTAEPTEEITAEPTEEPTEEVVTEAVTEVVTEEATEVATEEAEETVADADADPIAVALAAGDVANGETLFNASYETSSGVWMCTNCHSVDESQTRLIGPGLWGLHERGEERLADAGTEAETVPEYIYNSIAYPNDYIVPADEGGPYPANLMPQNYLELYSEQEFNDLVAYILTLGNEDVD